MQTDGNRWFDHVNRMDASELFKSMTVRLESVVDGM